MSFLDWLHNAIERGVNQRNKFAEKAKSDDSFKPHHEEWRERVATLEEVRKEYMNRKDIQ